MADRLIRRLLAWWTIRLLRRVVDVPGRLVVDVPGSGLLGPLLRGRAQELVVTTPRMVLDDLPLTHVLLYLRDVRLAVRWDAGPRLVVVGGTGRMEASLPGDEVRRRAGFESWLALTRGRARVGRSFLRMSLKPVLEGDRVRLSPTPVVMSLPPLPDGITLDGVEVEDDALGVHATLDLPLLLASAGT